MSDLQRFLDAQAGTFERARAELAFGRKKTHWIWFIFPQLAGLGASDTAHRYGLADRAEAEAYVRDPVLRPRLLDVTRVVAGQVAAGARLLVLMGSEIDALKLVSSLTLFERVAHDVGDAELTEAANSVLEAAARQGFDRCAFTLGRL